MTIAYNANVKSLYGFGDFHRLLFRWKGSILKQILPELITYIFAYYFVSFLYRFHFKHDPILKLRFELVVKYCNAYGNLVPLTFALGFFVTLILQRWWNQFLILPWPDNVAILCSACLRGDDERGRLMRRSIVRYINLSFSIVMTMMSSEAKERFPNIQYFVEAGLMLQHEKDVIVEIFENTRYPVYWVPTVWAANIIERARREGRVSDEMTYTHLIKAICAFRQGCGDLLSYDWITVPLAYVQLVTLAVYLHFFATLLGKQYIETDDTIDLYIPFFHFLEFFFYVGWLKVAEVLLNPFGQGDDDFEVNWIIDRNFQIGYLFADQMHGTHPKMLKDKYWDDPFVKLPYTKASIKTKIKVPHGSQYREVPENRARLIYDDDIFSKSSLKGKISTTTGKIERKLSGKSSKSKKSDTVPTTGPRLNSADSVKSTIPVKPLEDDEETNWEKLTNKRETSEIFNIVKNSDSFADLTELVEKKQEAEALEELKKQEDEKDDEAKKDK